jgi:hypothetical protein
MKYYYCNQINDMKGACSTQGDEKCVQNVVQKT